MPTTESPNLPFVDRRSGSPDSQENDRERRQFGSNYDDLSPAGRELGLAIDEYKVRHRRRFVTYDEMVGVVKSLGYKQG